MKKIITVLQVSLSIVVMLLLSSSSAFAQGSTTSSMSGNVTDDTGPLPGATIIAVHTPTGSEYGTISNMEGRYTIKNMKIGGPYRITISYVGFKDIVKEGIYLSLGNTYVIDFTMNETVTELEGVDVVADQSDAFNGNRTGSETIVDENQLSLMPNVSRSITDFTRTTPQASVTPGGGISIAGTNNRYNAIFVDGAVNNDVFGLASNGQNGGQIGISMISIDALDQLQVVVAPYDVTKGGFAGGGINAVTKSGTNVFHGSAYWLFRNQKIAGKTPSFISEDDREKLPDFYSNIYGITVGGPIVENKLFFFANIEIQRDENPRPFDVGSYTGDATPADLLSLESKLNELGYSPGSIGDNVSSLNGEKYLLKLDWNISKKHKLSLKNSYVKGVSVSPSSSSPTSIRFANGGINFSSITNTFTAELNSTFARNSNNLIVGVTTVRDDRDPMGDPFPYVFIKEGNVAFGSEQFSTANVLDQNIYTVTDNFSLYRGNHTITLGTHNEIYDIRNVFIRQNFGSYRFNSINDFVNDSLATQYDRSYSLVDDIAGDNTGAAADFRAAQFSVYAQDEWQASSQFTLTFGIRFDLPVFFNQPKADNYFNNVLSPSGVFEEQGWDLQNAKSGEAPSPKVLYSPRIGFNWKLNEKGTTQLRGGLGIFTSRIPFVWPGAMYNNNGSTVGGVRAFDIPFNPDPNNQPTKGDLSGEPDQVPQGELDLFVKDFKYPQVLRTSIAIDQKFGKGFIFTAEGIFTRTINNIFYQNLNLRKSVENFDGTPDNRPIYDRRNEVDDHYTRIILGSNTDEGYTYNFTVQLAKNFKNGLTANIAYTYGRSYAVFEGTSSQNSSQWRGAYSITGRNFTPNGISDFDTRSRIVAFVNYSIEYGGHFATSISAFYNGQTGRPFTYTYDDGFTNEDSRERAAIYIPRTQNEIFLIDDGDVTAEQQWTALNNYIENDPFLSKHRGEYAERNGVRAPFTGTIDLNIVQSFFFKGEKRTQAIEIGFDIFNFTNLLSSSWGKRYFTPNGGGTSIEVLNYEGNIAQGDFENIPTFTFNTQRKNMEDFLTPNDSGISSSRWQAQLSVRYKF